MKVRELIEMLSHGDWDAEVYVSQVKGIEGTLIKTDGAVRAMKVTSFTDTIRGKRKPVVVIKP